jgi:hypothetical protein
VDLLRRIAVAGGRLIYEPAAVVGHRVAPSRLRRRWFWSRCYWGNQGATRAIPDEELSHWSLRRPVWLLVLATHRTVWAACHYGLGSAECFYQSTRWVSSLGTSVGIAKRLWGRARKGTGSPNSRSHGPPEGQDSPPETVEYLALQGPMRGL